MKYIKCISAVLLLLLFLGTSAHEYPWEKYGIKLKVVTLSKGNYHEFHGIKDVVEIGSVLYNTQTKQIVGLVEKDTLFRDADLAPHIVSRWFSIDPMAEWDFARSPYNYVANNPIRYVDPDGNFKTKFGAFLWKVFNGGGNTLQDKPSGEYFVSQRVENTGDADITIKRVFKGQSRNYYRGGRGGSGSTVKGGIPFTKSGQSISPTNVRAENPDRPVNIDDLMPVINGAVPGRFQKSPLGIAQGIGKTSDALQEMSGIKSDREIMDSNTGIAMKTDAKGKPINHKERKNKDIGDSTDVKFYMGHYRVGEKAPDSVMIRIKRGERGGRDVTNEYW